MLRQIQEKCREQNIGGLYAAFVDLTKASDTVSREGSEEQEKMEETGCEIICGAPTTLVVKG